MAHDHNHQHAHHGHVHTGDISASDGSLNRAFVIGIVLNLAFVAVEAGAGFILGSVALISDAGHNLSDVVSLALALLAFRLAKLRPNDKYTYGRKKSTVIVSLANACILLVAIGMILYESIHKIFEPQQVEGEAIAWVAGVGIVINAFTAWLLMRHRKNDLNVKGAYLHMAADTLVSVGVVVSGIVISLTGWYILDPLIGIIIAVVILFSTWGLLKDSVRLSLDGVPRNIDLHQIEHSILEVPGVTGVHHIHIWPLSTTENALTAHIVTGSQTGIAVLKRSVKEMLRDHGIVHATLEFEVMGDGADTECCDDTAQGGCACS